MYTISTTDPSSTDLALEEKPGKLMKMNKAYLNNSSMLLLLQIDDEIIAQNEIYNYILRPGSPFLRLDFALLGRGAKSIFLQE